MRDDLPALRGEYTRAALSEAEVFDPCRVTFQAGHETTATALLWWSRLMASHPEAVAMLEMTPVAAMLLQRDTLALPDGAPAAEPVLIVTLRPRGGVVLDVRRRTVAIPLRE